MRMSPLRADHLCRIPRRFVGLCARVASPGQHLHVPCQQRHAATLSHPWRRSPQVLVRPAFSRTLSFWSDRAADVQSQDPYEVLGVSRDCSDADVKRAYLRAAREHHPDMNSEDAGSGKRFKRICDAYNSLKTADLRTRFKASRGTSAEWASSASAEETFSEAKMDREIVQEALTLYVDAVREELALAVEAVKQGELRQAYRLAREHRGLFAACAALLLVVRFPAAVMMSLRLVAALATSSLASGQLRRAFFDKAWVRLMTMARRQRAQMKDRKSDRKAHGDRYRRDPE